MARTDRRACAQRALTHGTMQNVAPGRLQLGSAGNDFITIQHEVPLMAASEQLIRGSSGGSL